MVINVFSGIILLKCLLLSFLLNEFFFGSERCNHIWRKDKNLYLKDKGFISFWRLLYAGNNFEIGILSEDIEHLVRLAF